MLISVLRKLPDGTTRTVHPFHMSLEGMSTAVICRDDEDYDVMVKVMCVAALRCNVIVIIYAVVSNYCHSAVLAASRADAEHFGKEVKRVYSMWMSRKHGERNIMDSTDSQAIPMSDRFHVRNALAYIPRNAMDNKCNVQEYPWTGFSAMFNSLLPGDAIPVSSLTRRARVEIMHTGQSLKNVPWLLDSDFRLIPRSFCDWEYLEQAFENDIAYWLRLVGGVNSAQMREKFIDGPREMKPDTECRKSVGQIASDWFGKSLSDLSMEQKSHLLPYVFRTMKTTVSQLARVFSIEQDKVKRMLCLRN